jgi:drug/metabolite transporter (DMT)-like permease
LGALLIFHEKLPGKFWLGLTIAMTGATLVLGLDALQDIQLGIGSLLGLLAGLFYGVYYLVTQRIR